MKKMIISDETKRKNVSPEINEAYAETLKKMVDCKTVFTRNGENKKEYDRFYSVIEESFPNIAKNARKLVFGSGCFVYVIEGRNADKNIMLMSHHDVVDGDDNWTTDPFNAVKKNGALWGRGTIDTKTPLFAS